MENNTPIRCRVIACRETLADGKEWSFYFINDGLVPFDLVELCEIDYEWGDSGNADRPCVRVTGIAPGGHVLMWRDDGSGAEVRMNLVLQVRVFGREERLHFSFPKLYRQHNLPMIDCLGMPGWLATPEVQES